MRLNPRHFSPCELVGQVVSIHNYPDRIDFAAHDAVVASHSRCFERNQPRYDWQHYIPPGVRLIVVQLIAEHVEVNGLATFERTISTIKVLTEGC